MHKISLMLSALTLSAAIGFAAPAFAEDLMIGGKVVPADQVAAVQAKCDTFKPSESLTTSTDATTDDMVGSDNGATGGVDLETLTMESCMEGGFMTSAKEHKMGGMMVPTEQVEAVQAKCDTMKAAEPTQTLTDSTDAATTTNTVGSDGGTSGFDMEKITMAMCVEGGFVPAS